MLSGKMLYAVHNGTYIIKLSGDVRVSLVATIDEFFYKMFLDPELESVLFDLTECTGIDSTTLGLLAKVSLESQDRFHCYPTIVSSNSDITKILHSMGFEKVFNLIESDASTPAKMNELPPVDCTEAEVCHKVITAHKVLMELNEKNRLAFTSVVQALEGEQLSSQAKA